MALRVSMAALRDLAWCLLESYHGGSWKVSMVALGLELAWWQRVSMMAIRELAWQLLER